MDNEIATMENNVKLQVEQAIKYLDQGALEKASILLNEVIAGDKTNLVAHNLRERHRLPGCFSDWMGVNATISPDDDIFRFFCNHPSSQNPIRDYLADGWRTMMELQEVLGAVDKPLWKCTSFLEFACGHGRFTRHLARVLSSQQLAVSDIVPGTVDFLETTFGIPGFYSSSSPQKLVIPRRYEVIFVLSLFSHLPFSAWRNWISKLHSALKPGGVLVFSTHGESFAKQEGVDLEANGTRYFPSSESSALEGEQYGTAFAKAETVRKIIEESISGAPTIIKYIPTHFWGRQDAFMVVSA